MPKEDGGDVEQPELPDVDGEEVKMEVKVGDQVIYSKYAGTDVKLDEEECIVVRQNDILAVIEA